MLNNNIDINIDKTASSCVINFNNISFSVNSTQLYTKDIQEEILNAYKVEDKAIIEATTYNKHLMLTVDADNMTLISEDRDRVAVVIDDEPITQLTAIKVVNEEGNTLKHSLQPQEHGIELVIEEETNKALVSLEIASYVIFNSEGVQHLNRFYGVDYWIASDAIYRTNPITQEIERYSSKNTLSITDYVSMPHMMSKDIFHKKGYGFYKIENGTVLTLLKSDTEYHLYKWLYDEYYIGMKVVGTGAATVLEYNILTVDLETFDKTVIASHSIALGMSSYVNEYYPNIVQEDDKRIVFSCHNYANDGDLPKPGNTERISFVFNKETLEIDYCGLPVECVICYLDDEYILYSDLRNGGIYLNNDRVHASIYLLKPLTSIKENKLYLHDYSYSATTLSTLYELNIGSKALAHRGTIFDRYYSVTSTAALTKNTDTTTEYKGAYVIMHDSVSLSNRSLERLSMDDLIIPEGVTTTSSYAKLMPGQSIFVKNSSIFNKNFFTPLSYSVLQRGKYIYIGELISHTSNMEIRNDTMNYMLFTPNTDSFVISNNDEFKKIESNIDVKRVSTNIQYELVPKKLDKVDGRYYPNFESYGEGIEDFEGPSKIDWRTNYGETPFDIKAGPNGTLCAFMGTTKGSSKLWSEFTTLSPKIDFDYFVSSEDAYDWFRLYVNGVKKFEASDVTMTAMEHLSFDLDRINESVIRFAYENDGSGDKGESGFYIDNIVANMKVKSNMAILDFDTVDYGIYQAPVWANLLFNDLVMSDNVRKFIYYSADNGETWTEFKGLMPNKDNIMLKAIFLKDSAEEEADLSFESITVMPREFEYTTAIDTDRWVKPLKFNISLAVDASRVISINAENKHRTLREVELLEPLITPYIEEGSSGIASSESYVYLGRPFNKDLWTRTWLNKFYIYSTAFGEEQKIEYDIEGIFISSKQVNAPTMIFNDVIRTSYNQIFRLYEEGSYERLQAPDLEKYIRVERLHDDIWIGVYTDSSKAYYDLLDISEDLEVRMLDTTFVRFSSSYQDGNYTYYMPVVMQRADGKILINLCFGFYKFNSSPERGLNKYIDLETRAFETPTVGNYEFSLLYEDDEWIIEQGMKDLRYLQITHNGETKLITDIPTGNDEPRRLRLLSIENGELIFAQFDAEGFFHTNLIVVRENKYAAYESIEIVTDSRMAYGVGQYLITENEKEVNAVNLDNLRLRKLKLDNVEYEGDVVVNSTHIQVGYEATFSIKPYLYRSYKPIFMHNVWNEVIQGDSNIFKTHNGNTAYTIRCGGNITYDKNNLYILEEKRSKIDVELPPEEVEISIAAKTNRQVVKDISIAASSIRKAINTVSKAFNTLRTIISHSIHSMTVDTMRKVVKQFNYSNDSDLKRQVIKNSFYSASTRRLSFKDIINNFKSKRAVVDTKAVEMAVKRIVVANNINSLDTDRIINISVSIMKNIDTRRIVFKPGAIYVTQLNITYKLEKGLLVLDSQDFH